MMQRKSKALLLLVQLVFALTAMLMTVLPAQAVGVGSVSGHVFVDANSNGMAEPGEVAVAGAKVIVAAKADASHSYEVTTDAAGLFILSGLEYGIYEVSASADGKVVQGHTEIEIAEVNAQVLIDVPVYDSVDLNMTVKSGRLFLPLLRP